MKTKILLSLFVLFLLRNNSVFSQWIQTNGPAGISVKRFFDNGQFLFAGTTAKGAFKSSDHGLHWQAANAGIVNRDVFSFEQDSFYLYAGTDSGVYRSSDTGNTWVAANVGIETQFGNCLLIAEGCLFMGTVGSGVFRSCDKGNTWTAVNGGAIGSSYIHAMVYRAPRLLVEADNYIFVSDTSGSAWTPDQGTTAFYVIDNFLEQGDTIFASVNGIVFRTVDGGANWSNPITVDNSIKILGLSLISDTLYAGYAMGYYFSANWGNSWHGVTGTGLRFGQRFNNHFIRSGKILLLAMDDIGVYISTNYGVDWSQSNTGFPPASTIDDCLLIAGNDLWSGTHSDGVYVSHDDGNIWTKIGTLNPLDSLSNGIIFSMLNPAPHVFLAGACGYGLYRSTNDGVSWSHITSGLPVQAGTGFFCVYNLEKSATNVITATDEGIYYSTDTGFTWHSTNISGTGYSAQGLASHGTILCAGVVDNILFTSGMYRSSDKGVTWNSISSGAQDVLAIAADTSGYFYAGTFTDNFYSSDNGLSWNAVGPGIPSGAGGFTVVAVDSNVFFGNSRGIWHSSNHAASFTNASQGLDPYPNNAVQSLRASGTHLFAGTFQDAVWRRPLSDFGIIVTANENITENNVRLNVFPNPVNSSATIQYSVSENSFVSLSITDLCGRIMKVLTADNQFIGEYKLKLNTDNISPGIYLIQLKTTNHSATQKMVVTR